MRLRNITLAGIILLMLAFVISPVYAETDNVTADSTNIDTNSSDEVAAGVEEEQLDDDIKPDESIIGPDNVFYSFTIALDDLDVTFTFNETEKIEKQISKARKRLGEIKAALNKKNSKAADIAIEQYREENEKANESISKLKTNDGGLIRAQVRIAQHQYVLDGLIESHPNNTGLLRAHDNSVRLLTKFASKTKVKLERRTDKKGHKVLTHVRVDDDEEDGKEKTQVKASVEDNKTNVKVELKFVTNSTEPAKIAGDILERIDAIESNISGIIKIERDNDEADEQEDDEADEEDDVEDDEKNVTGGPTETLTVAPNRNRIAKPATEPKEKLKADAEVKRNTTTVKFEYMFFLNVTEDPAIIAGVKEKLSTLTAGKILSVLDVKVIEKRVEIKEKKVDDRKNAQINEKTRENKRGQSDREDSEED